VAFGAGVLSFGWAHLEADWLSENARRGEDEAAAAGHEASRRSSLGSSRRPGVEPHAPRIRFLCRPEIAVIDLVGE